MASCKDCIHEIVCFRAARMTKKEKISFVVDDKANGCSYFIKKIILCKDCRHYENRKDEVGYCYFWDCGQSSSPNWVGPDDFCSGGERKKQLKLISRFTEFIGGSKK